VQTFVPEPITNREAPAVPGLLYLSLWMEDWFSLLGDVVVQGDRHGLARASGS